MNHCGTTAGPPGSDGHGTAAEAFPLGKDAGRPRAGRPPGVAAGTTPPWMSLRDGRRRRAGAFLPRCLQRWRGGRPPHQRDDRGHVVACKRSGVGGRLSKRGHGTNEATGTPRRTSPLWTVGDVVADKAAGGEGGRGPPLQRAHATAVAIVAPVKVVVQDTHGARERAVGDVAAHETARA